MSGWSIIRSYIWKNRWYYAGGALLNIVGSAGAVMIPRLIGDLTDRLQAGTIPLQATAGVALVVMALALGRALASWLGRTLIHRKGRMLMYELRGKLFAKWSTLSPGYYHGHSTGDLLSHALSDVDVVRELVTMGINVSVGGISMIFLMCWTMVVHVDWRLTVVGLAPLLLIPFFVQFFGPKIRERSRRSQEALSAMSQTVEEAVSGIRAVKAFGNEAVVAGRFEKKIDTILQEKMGFVRLSSLFGALVPLMGNLSFTVALGYGGFLVIDKTITLGNLVMFTLYITMMRMPLESLGMVLNAVQRASASLQRLDGLLRVVPAVSDGTGDLTDQPVKGELRVENLTFRYSPDGRAVLEGVSFNIKPGHTLGIVGSMGSGKTTLVNLLLRMYDPPAGTVFIDGRDILQYPLLSLRQGIAYVPQDGFLFSTTLLENIAFADDQPDLKRAEQAAQMAEVHDNITHFPDGYATGIGERGVRLSGGQKQRVAIARMLYKNAHIRILDDSLSAVDTTAEHNILHNVGCGETCGDGIRIIISHRLSAVRPADHILVLEGGRVVEVGAHAALLELGSVYARLWAVQSGQLDQLSAGHAVETDAPSGELIPGTEALPTDPMAEDI